MYRHKNVLVTGGLGFIGSNLVHRLAALGARITVVDSMVAGCGGNHFNLSGLEDSVRVVTADIADTPRFAVDLARADVIFNLAGEISHTHSMRFPERDLALNVVSQLRFLEECAQQRPGVRVVYASTRQIYGSPRYLPVDEQHPVQPVDFNGIHKYAATAYHLLLTAAGHLDAVVFCLTNVYGPRMGIDNPCQGFLSNFIRRAVTGQNIEIFGDGRQLRDPVYVDDLVDLLVLAGLMDSPPTRLYNVGGPEVLSVARIAEMMCTAAGIAAPQFREFPEEARAIDIGSYCTDPTLLRQELGWKAAVLFEEGLAHTLDYFRRELSHYLDPNMPNPPCKVAGTYSPKAVPAV